jgi:predicted cupin superfamily sugar epimerase
LRESDREKVLEMNAETIIRQLNLQPHPEGGFYRETYRNGEKIAAAALPPRYDKDRNLSTAIYYLLTPDSFSSLHRLQSDEIFHPAGGRDYADGLTTVCPSPPARPHETGDDSRCTAG